MALTRQDRDPHSPFAVWLTERIVERGWSQRAFVRASEGRISAPQLSQWLTGRRSPNSTSIAIIADVLGVDAATAHARAELSRERRAPKPAPPERLAMQTVAVTYDRGRWRRDDLDEPMTARRLRDLLEYDEEPLLAGPAAAALAEAESMAEQARALLAHAEGARAAALASLADAGAELSDIAMLERTSRSRTAELVVQGRRALRAVA